MSSTPSLSPESAPTVWRRTGALIAGRAARWARRRQGLDPVPVELAPRRIYILPTGIGITYALMVFAMLLGSMNYNNSMAFALTFLLAALGLVAMHHCQRNLAGLIVAFTGADPVFAGDPARLHFTLRNEGVAPRLDIGIDVGESASSRVDVPSGGHSPCTVSLPTARRGRLRLSRYGVRSTYPLTLFRAWAWIHADTACRVWPRPAQDAPPLPLSAPSPGRRRAAAAGDDDFAGLRDFQDGDPPRHLAWKTYARSGELKTKRFSGTEARLAWLDIRDAPGSDLEERLSVLCRWVLDAEHTGLRYGLRVGRTGIEPSRGPAHRASCLDALADFDEGSAGDL